MCLPAARTTFENRNEIVCVPCWRALPWLPVACRKKLKFCHVTAAPRVPCPCLPHSHPVFPSLWLLTKYPGFPKGTWLTRVRCTPSHLAWPFLRLCLPRFYLFFKIRPSLAFSGKPSLIAPWVGKESFPCAPVQAQRSPSLSFTKPAHSHVCFPLDRKLWGAGIFVRFIVGI